MRRLAAFGFVIITWSSAARVPAHADELPLKAIEDPTGAMKRLHGALARVAGKQAGAIVRIVHYGDSITSNDVVSGAAREQLQKSYGDGGAGFVPVALPSPSYRHFGVKRKHKGWKVKNVTFKNTADKRYGIGGSAFEGSAGAESTYSTVPGSGVARFDVYYLVQPKGGQLSLTVDAEAPVLVDTAGADVKSGFHAIDVPDGAHTFKLKVESGKVRVFGVVMERKGPGVTYDNLALASNSAKSLKGMRADFARQQYDHRDADLIVIHLGANEADWYGGGPKSIADYTEVYTELVKLLRAAAPKTSCLVMSSTDSAVLVDGKYETKPGIPGMVDAQRKIAAAHGCAFWDAFTWMGGKGSVRKWRKDGNWEPDLIHPNKSGGALLAKGLVSAIRDSYARAGGK